MKCSSSLIFLSLYTFAAGHLVKRPDLPLYEFVPKIKPGAFDDRLDWQLEMGFNDACELANAGLRAVCTTKTILVKW